MAAYSGKFIQDGGGMLTSSIRRAHGVRTKVGRLRKHSVLKSEARFKRRILHAPNAIQTMHNEEAYLIIYCLNCIRCMQNSTFETGLIDSQ